MLTDHLKGESKVGCVVFGSAADMSSTGYIKKSWRYRCRFYCLEAAEENMKTLASLTLLVIASISAIMAAEITDLTGDCSE